MRIAWLKLILGAIAAEITAILILVALVALFGPNNLPDAQLYAEKLGHWVGPIAGAILSFLGALWIARSLPRGQLVHGTLFGLFMALIDVALLLSMQASFEWLFVLSNAGKILAGIAGGSVSKRLGNRT